MSLTWETSKETQLIMESMQQRRSSRARKPLSDCTNTVTSSQSYSASTSTTHLKHSSSIPKLLSHSNPNSDDTSNTSSLLFSSPTSTPLHPPRPPLSSGAGDSEVCETRSVYSLRATSLKRKKRTPAEQIRSISGKTKEDGDKNLSNALTTPCKKRRKSCETDINKSPKTDISKSALQQEFVEQQRAYFAEIDAFELPEEEVESIHDLE